MSDPHCPPPRGFKPAGTVLWARLKDDPPSFAKRPKPRGRKALGIRYERKVLDHLAEGPLPLLRSPWIEFATRESAKKRWCQPDGVLVDPWEGRLVLVEVKYQHTSAAWWQLTQLYAPVLAALLPDWEIHLAEVCKWYDPAISFPVKPRLLPCLEAAKAGSLGVHIWKP